LSYGGHGHDGPGSGPGRRSRWWPAGRPSRSVPAPN